MGLLGLQGGTISVPYCVLMLFLVMVTLASLSACIIYLIAQQEDGDINSLLSNAIMIYEGYYDI